MLVTMGDLVGKVPNEVDLQPISTVGNGAASHAPTSGKSFITNTIAAHIGAATGLELVICALATLEIVQGKSSATRSEILAEMQKATKYFNKNMSGNLTGSLNSLVTAKRINEVATECYALAATERAKIEARVAEIA